MPLMGFRFGVALSRTAPWLMVGALVAVAFWHVRAFDVGPDGEFPRVARQTYSAYAPAAYRFAEPGDTLDRVALYLAAAGVALSGWGIVARWGSIGARAWIVGFVLAAFSLWEAATPWPTFDGWHGWNWRAIGDADAPIGLRLAFSALILAGLGVAASSVRGLRLAASCGEGNRLFVLSGLMVLWRVVGWPDHGPQGYWPRWGFVWGLLAFDLGLIRRLRAAGWGSGRRSKAVFRGCVAIGVCVALVVAGRTVLWFHRPLERLRTVEPGRIYMSAMPTYRGLTVAHGRHRFKTIVNLFHEEGRQRSPRLPEELRFAREHGITYIESPGDARLSDRFLDETLALAQNPAAWPILVHCHGCMDRTPAWMGIYRFLVQGRPLEEVLREIEQHRGLRPKASVTLLYNRVLPTRAGERYERDPVGRQLRRNAEGTIDPFYKELRAEIEKAGDSGGIRRVGRVDQPDLRRP
jgi:hypothetical protein